MALGEFLFKIRGDTTQFGASIGSATGKLNQFGGAVQSVFTRYVLPYFGARAMAQYARGTMQWADNLVDFANKTGFTTEQLQELEHAARLTGVSMQSFSNAVRYMGLAQSQASMGNKEFIDMFERWGMTDWKTLSPGEAMYKAMRRMEGSSNISAQTFRDLQNMMGRSATELIPAMVEGIDNFARGAHDAGLIIEDGIVQNLARANDQWDTLMAKTKAAGVGPLEKLLRLVNMGGIATVNAWNVAKEATGFLNKGEAQSKFEEMFNTFMETWYLPELNQGAIESAAGRSRKSRASMDFANLAKAGGRGGGGGLSAETDQWGRMGLYATSGQQIYQRSVLMAIRSLQKDVAAIKNNTGDTAQTIDERF